MRTLRPSLPTQMTQETGQRPNGAAAAILAVSTPHIVARAHFNGGLPAAVLPPAQLRTPMFARQSRRFPTLNRAPGRFEGRKSWRPSGKACFDIRQLVY